MVGPVLSSKVPISRCTHPRGRRVINLDLNRRIELPLDLSGLTRINGDEVAGEAPQLKFSGNSSPPPPQLEFSQLCVASKQSLNVSKESVKAAEIEPASEGLNYRRVTELPELD